MATYPIDDRTKAYRHNERTTYDAPLIHSILSSTPVVHVAFNTPLSPNQAASFPSVLPMLAAPSPSSPSVIYLHGSSAARLAQLIAAAPPAGLPVTVSAASVDGYVLALSPFSHSVNYRSAVIFGRARAVTGEEEVLAALEAVTEALVPGRWARTRVPPTKGELRQTGVWAVEIETASAKVRTGPPSSERRDLRDEDVLGRVWTGVVPLHQVLGEPRPAEENRVPDVPGYIEGWVREGNARNRAYAERVAGPEE